MAYLITPLQERQYGVNFAIFAPVLIVPLLHAASAKQIPPDIGQNTDHCRSIADPSFAHQAITNLADGT